MTSSGDEESVTSRSGYRLFPCLKYKDIKERIDPKFCCFYQWTLSVAALTVSGLTKRISLFTKSSVSVGILCIMLSDTFINNLSLPPAQNEHFSVRTLTKRLSYSSAPLLPTAVRSINTGPPSRTLSQSHRHKNVGKVEKYQSDPLKHNISQTIFDQC